MLKKVLKKALAVFTLINDDEIFMYAAQSSFYIITASIPFMMLFLALLKFFIPLNENEVLMFLESFVPELLRGYVAQIINELFTKPTAIVSITSIIIILWSASRGVAAVERGVKRVYKTKKQRNFITEILFSFFYTLLFMIALLATLILMVFGGIIYDILSSHIDWLVTLEKDVGDLREIIYFIALCAFFTFVYKVFAGKGSKVKTQLFGAMFTTLGWFIFSFFFSIYIENFANYSYVYGSLTMIVLMMLWLYSCMIIFLLGAEINVYIDKKTNS